MGSIPITGKCVIYKMTGSGRLLCRKLLLDYERVLIILLLKKLSITKKNPVHCLVEAPTTLVRHRCHIITNDGYYR